MAMAGLWIKGPQNVGTGQRVSTTGQATSWVPGPTRAACTGGTNAHNPGMKNHFADRLQTAIDAKSAPVCAGLDPRPDWIPREFFARAHQQHGNVPAAIVAAVSEFCLEVTSLVAPHVAAVKPNAAFFEALGPGGYDILFAISQRAHELGLLVIADVKRGDIGSTSDAYASSLFGSTQLEGITLPSMQADAATVSPYLGSDGVLPFVKRAREHGCGIYVLARTSNPGSAELQQLVLKSGSAVVDEMARLIEGWGAPAIGACGYSDVGAVVGATHPDAAVHLRKLMPHTHFLVPGWGAQGGDAKAVRACFDAAGKGAIVNSSRGVMHAYANGPLKAYGEARWREAVSDAAAQLRREVHALSREPLAG